MELTDIKRSNLNKNNMGLAQAKFSLYIGKFML